MTVNISNSTLAAWTAGKRVFIYKGLADGRHSFKGLIGIVKTQRHREPAPDEAYIFVVRGQDRIKVLVGDHTGPTIRDVKSKWAGRFIQQFEKLTVKASA